MILKALAKLNKISGVLLKEQAENDRQSGAALKALPAIAKFIQTETGEIKELIADQSSSEDNQETKELRESVRKSLANDRLITKAIIKLNDITQLLLRDVNFTTSAVTSTLPEALTKLIRTETKKIRKMIDSQNTAIVDILQESENLARAEKVIKEAQNIKKTFLRDDKNEVEGSSSNVLVKSLGPIINKLSDNSEEAGDRTSRKQQLIEILTPLLSKKDNEDVEEDYDENVSKESDDALKAQLTGQKSIIKALIKLTNITRTLLEKEESEERSPKQGRKKLKETVRGKGFDSEEYYDDYDYYDEESDERTLVGKIAGHSKDLDDRSGTKQLFEEFVKLAIERQRWEQAQDITQIIRTSGRKRPIAFDYSDYDDYYEDRFRPLRPKRPNRPRRPPDSYENCKYDRQYKVFYDCEKSKEDSDSDETLEESESSSSDSSDRDFRGDSRKKSLTKRPSRRKQNKNSRPKQSTRQRPNKRTTTEKPFIEEDLEYEYSEYYDYPEEISEEKFLAGEEKSNEAFRSTQLNVRNHFLRNRSKAQKNKNSFKTENNLKEQQAHREEVRNHDDEPEEYSEDYDELYPQEEEEEKEIIPSSTTTSTTTTRRPPATRRPPPKLHFTRPRRPPTTLRTITRAPSTTPSTTTFRDTSTFRPSTTSERSIQDHLFLEKEAESTTVKVKTPLAVLLESSKKLTHSTTESSDRNEEVFGDINNQPQRPVTKIPETTTQKVNTLPTSRTSEDPRSILVKLVKSQQKSEVPRNSINFQNEVTESPHKNTPQEIIKVEVTKSVSEEDLRENPRRLHLPTQSRQETSGPRRLPPRPGRPGSRRPPSLRHEPVTQAPETVTTAVPEKLAGSSSRDRSKGTRPHSASDDEARRNSLKRLFGHARNRLKPPRATTAKPTTTPPPTITKPAEGKRDNESQQTTTKPAANLLETLNKDSRQPQTRPTRPSRRPPGLPISRPSISKATTPLPKEEPTTASPQPAATTSGTRGGNPLQNLLNIARKGTQRPDNDVKVVVTSSSSTSSVSSVRKSVTDNSRRVIVRKQGVRKSVKKKKPVDRVDPKDLTPQERLVNKVRETLNVKKGEEGSSDKEKEDNSTTEIHSGGVFSYNESNGVS